MTDDGCFSQAMVLPCSIYLKASSSSQTFKTAFLPRSRKSRQKIQISFVRLQKDFSYTGCTAHVAVQLEGRMSTQEIEYTPPGPPLLHPFDSGGWSRRLDNRICLAAFCNRAQ